MCIKWYIIIFTNNLLLDMGVFYFFLFLIFTLTSSMLDSKVKLTVKYFNLMEFEKKSS